MVRKDDRALTLTRFRHSSTAVVIVSGKRNNVPDRATRQEFINKEEKKDKLIIGLQNSKLSQAAKVTLHTPNKTTFNVNV